MRPRRVVVTYGCRATISDGNAPGGVALPVAATSTSTVALGTGVMQLPLRRAAAVAKQIGSLQLLTGGRVVFGVGVGQHVGEYAAAGVDYGTRGRALDDALATIRS